MHNVLDGTTNGRNMISFSDSVGRFHLIDATIVNVTT
jgi:hypothetical protein